MLEVAINTTADGEFVPSFEDALALGVQSQTFSVDWNAIDLGSDGDTALFAARGELSADL